MSGGKNLETIELENNPDRASRTVQTPAIFSIIGAKTCTHWLPPKIERDETGLIKTGGAVASATAVGEGGMAVERVHDALGTYS